MFRSSSGPEDPEAKGDDGVAVEDGNHAQVFAEALLALYRAADSPPYSVLVRQAAAQRPPVKLTDASISDWLHGVSTPSKPATVEFLVRYLKAKAAQSTPEHRSPALGQWEELRRKAEEQRNAHRRGRPARRHTGRSEDLSIQKTSSASLDYADRAMRSAVPAEAEQAIADSSPVNALPRDLPDFTGREAEVAYIVDFLKATRSTDRPTPILAIDGMAGVGKTSLAVHIGHELALRYPNVLFLDLRSHTEGQPPLGPGEALEIMLTMLGVPGERIAIDFDRRVTQWRSELATRGALIVLDNASSAEQVEALLPSGSGCLVIITSRTRLIGLDGVHPLSLETMKPAEAIEFFMRILGADRVRAEPGPVAAVALRCGYLPLAMRLVSSWLRHHPARSVRDILNRLAGTLNPVMAAFQMSYRDLSDDQRLMFRRLGLHPGQTFTDETAAALSEVDRDQARELLDELYDRHLIDEPQGNRYQFHDLIRSYARSLARDYDSESDRNAAIDRLIEYYIAAVALQERGRNYKWFDDEMPELLACAYHAMERGEAGYAWRLTRALAVVMQVRGLYRQARRLQTGALEAATMHGDKRVQASCHIDLSILDRVFDDRKSALRHARESLQLYEEIDDKNGRANAITEIGVIYREVGEHQKAREYLLQAFDLYAELGIIVGQGNVAGALASLFRETGDLGEARDYLIQAFNLYNGINEPLGKANIHFDLGCLDKSSSDFEAAIEHFQGALSLYAELGDLSAQAEAHTQLGDLYDQVGDHERALAHQKEARDIRLKLESSKYDPPPTAT